MYRLRTPLLHLASIILIAPFAFVFVFMIWNSFKPEFLFFEPGVWIFKPTLDNYRSVLTLTRLGDNLLTSLIVSGLATAIGITAGVMTAYTIARFKLKKLAMAILVTRMIPFVTMLIPLWLMYSALGLINTLAGVIIAHLVITIPFGVWILIAYIEDIPVDLEDAAQIDGATRLQAFFRVVVPLCRPGILAASTLCFIFSWNNFQFALILGGVNIQTAPVAVYQFANADAGNMGAMLAAATLVTIPGFLLAIFAQKHMSSGLTAGGISK